MNHTKRDLIIKLETLSRIPKNGKLNLTANDIEIYQNGWIEWFKRWKNGDGREKTIERLNHFFDHVLQTSNDMINCIAINCEDIKDKAEDLNAIATELANSIVGINNLRDTYVDDQKINAQLRFICEQYIAVQYHKIIDSLEHYNKKLVPKLKPDVRDLISTYSPSYKKSPVMIPNIPHSSTSETIPTFSLAKNKADNDETDEE